MPLPMSPFQSPVLGGPPAISALVALQSAGVNLHLLSERLGLYLTKALSSAAVRDDVVWSEAQLEALHSGTWSALIRGLSDCAAPSATSSPASSRSRSQALMRHTDDSRSAPASAAKPRMHLAS